MRLRRVAATAAAAVVVLLAAAPGQASLADDPVKLGGTPIQGGGSTDSANPTELTAGVWLDDLGSDSASGTHYYEYTRTTEGEETSTVLVGATTTGLPNTSDSINLDVSTPDDVSCAGDQASRSAAGLWPFGTSVFAGSTDGESFDGSCTTARTLRIKLTHDTAGEQDIPVAIKIVEEARVQTIEGLPVGVKPDTPVPTPDVSGEPEPLAGATSLTEAPELTTGRFTTTLLEGGAQVWKVPLDWGQNLIVRARIPKVAPEEEGGSVYGPEVELSVLNPMGGATDILYENELLEDYVDEEEPVELIHATGPVRLQPRYDDETSGVTTPGDFYVVLGAATLDDPERDRRELPVTLDVEIRGDGEPAPSYFKEKPFLVGPDTRSHVVSGTGVSKAEQEALDAKRTQRIIAATALALVGLAATGGGLTLLRRR